MGKATEYPLRYQASEFDCLPTSIINALTHLFPISRIPGEVIKMIYCYSLDDIDKNGRIQGTKTNAAIKSLKAYLSVECKILLNDQVKLAQIEDCLNDKGVSICGIYSAKKEEHTVLVTHCDPKWVYIWDPYPYSENALRKVTDVKIIRHQADTNIKVRRERFDSWERKKFSLGETDRWCYLIWPKSRKRSG